MEARLISAALCVAAFLSLGASYRTQHFLVTAPTPQFAQQVAKAAETMRRDLAVEWLGAELPPWGEVCPITVHVGPKLGAGGATSFAFVGGRPTGWTMTIQGSPERVLDSVLPHEITHTVFATHFGCPLPRWADEGACTTVEHVSEREKQHRLLYEFLTTGRGIAFNQMFAMREYPPDVLPLYSQGYSLARYLIAQGGKRKFVQYVGDGMRMNSWTQATKLHYGFESLSNLQLTWIDWVQRGSPDLARPAPQTVLAQAESSAPQNVIPIDQPLRATAPRGAKTQLASVSTSWYARVRDENRAVPRTSPPTKSMVQVAPAAEENSPAAQLVTRPPAPERAQQRVIEWSQPHRPSAPGSFWR